MCLYVVSVYMSVQEQLNFIHYLFMKLIIVILKLVGGFITMIRHTLVINSYLYRVHSPYEVYSAGAMLLVYLLQTYFIPYSVEQLHCRLELKTNRHIYTGCKIVTKYLGYVHRKYKLHKSKSYAHMYVHMYHIS